jgi:hypothetical protein
MHIETKGTSISVNACYKASQVKYLLGESNDAEGCLCLLTTGCVFFDSSLSFMWSSANIPLIYTLCLSL